MNVPEGYVQDGDIYVYRPIQSPAPSPANESEISSNESVDLGESEVINTFDIDDGTGAVLKAQRVIDRKVDVGAFDALRKMQNEQWGEQRMPGAVPGVPLLKLDELVKWKPEVSITEYRKLTDNERAYFDQCLIIKDGSPQLEVVIPKRAKV
jgi:hypothetical protein